MWQAIRPWRRRSRVGAGVVAILLAAASVAGCGDQGGSDRSPSPSPSPARSAALIVKDPWVKATDAGMTAAFAVLVNPGGTDVTVTGATSPASPVEIHEMAMRDGKAVMQPKAGGLVVKAHGSHELKPGADHLMLMNPAAPVRPGDEVPFTLVLSGGGSVPFTAIAKPFAGAGESYDPGAGSGAHRGMPSATS